MVCLDFCGRGWTGCAGMIATKRAAGYDASRWTLFLCTLSCVVLCISSCRCCDVDSVGDHRGKELSVLQSAYPNDDNVAVSLGTGKRRR